MRPTRAGQSNSIELIISFESTPQADIVAPAVRRYLQECFIRRDSPEEILRELTPEALDKFLYTCDCPDPDLIIRTSGEVRLSGFMLWQSTYSEFYFCDAYWPAFRKIDFLRAIRSYQRRERRFGH